MGKAFRYGNNIDTDVIIPARCLNIMDKKELATHCMEDLDAGFATAVRPSDVVVAGTNFGCGSSREHAPMVLQQCGVACVVAKSFARIFYRNAINIGLPILECQQAAENIAAGDEVTIDFGTGIITNVTKGQQYQSQPFPPFISEMIRSGGLLKWVAGYTTQ